MRNLIALSISLLLLSFVPAQAQAPETECDRLDAHPWDPERITDGVDFEDLDADRAIPACEAAVEQYPTELRLQYQYARALSKAERHSEAVALFQRLDYATAHYNLSIAYEEGKEIDQSDTENLKFTRLAAMKGHAVAQGLLGSMYRKGEGVAQDHKKAVRLYTLAARQGLDPAQNNLGSMYANGIGVSTDYKEAAKWYRLAAEQGNDYGLRSLGNLYRQGLGVEQHFNKAMELLQKSKHEKVPEDLAKMQDTLIEDLLGRCLYEHRRDITNNDQKEIIETECSRQLQNKSLERLIREYEKD